MSSSDPPVIAEFWEQWVCSRKEPVDYAQRDAKVRRETVRDVVTHDDLFGGTYDAVKRAGRKLITFTRTRPDGVQEQIVDMPDNSLTKACGEARHGDCNHRLGAIAEGGVLLCYGPTRFVWRCGCACHRDPARAGRLL